ncbi:MAG TPA: hypothetical protein VHC22_24230 [Pirellulales bacterium]|nr:hypothetical protein [Pirellulales bacterium]
MNIARISCLSLLALLAQASAGAVERDAKARPLFRDFMGLNVHTVQFKVDLYRPITRLLRDYHPFDWDVGNETDYAPRFPMARNGVDWQALYGSWKDAGYSIDVCWMFDGVKPDAWKDMARDAEAYGEAVGRFFGPSGKHPFIEAVEIGNEPGKYDDAAYRTLFESAARGMRRGDPKLLISTCAVFAMPSGAYHKDIATVRGLESLYDVINVHSYPELEGYPTWRRSFPEDSRLEFLKRIRDVIDWRDAHAPDKQVWLTEFGWDATTKPQATEGDFKQWVGVTDVQQAQYLVRAFLTLTELDLDRAYIFFFNDDDQAQVHASSGLTRHFRPKPAFYAVAHLFSVLGDYRFERVVSKKEGELVVDEFRHGNDESRLIWVAWSPTGDGKQAVVRLPLPRGKIERAERMPFKEGASEAVSWKVLDNDDGKDEVEMEIGESPVYLHIRQ